MGALILVEHDNHKMLAATRHVLTAALQLDARPSMLVVGHQCHAVAEEVSALQGVAEVLLFDDAACANHLPEVVSQVMLTLSERFSYILGSSSTFCKNIIPRCAAKLDVGQISDVTRVIDANTYEHPIYAGNAVETVRLLDSIQVLTIRTTSFEAVNAIQPPCTIEKITAVIQCTTTRFMDHQVHISTRPDLKNAQIVVSGGRGLGSAEHFKLIETLADALGAAVGASRAAVDAGFISNDYQVGQTGKIVAPKLYIAVGISGAVQHLAGMKDSKVIVAINQDPDAPILQIASYALLGDLFTLVPQLIDELKKRGISKC